jgi:hypothetical protein
MRLRAGPRHMMIFGPSVTVPFGTPQRFRLNSAAVVQASSRTAVECPGTFRR